MEQKSLQAIGLGIGGGVVLLGILFFFSKDTFAQIASMLLLVGIPVCGIFLLIAPFWYVRKRMHTKKPIAYGITLIVSLILIYGYWKLLVLLFRWMLKITISDIAF